MTKPFKFDPARYEGHTRGPWVSESRDTYYCISSKAQINANVGHICCVNMWREQQNHLKPSKFAAEFNATLIADAPELLAEVVRLRAALGKICAVDCPEINMSNYNEDDASTLNRWSIEIYQIAKEALEEPA